MVINNYNKGITSIVKAIAAMSNNDDKELIVQANRIDNYLKDNPISLILKAESAKKAKKMMLQKNIIIKCFNFQILR